MGMKTPSLISNTSFQQPSMHYSWLSTSNKMPLLNQQVSFNNPFEQNKSLYDWQNFLNGYQQQQSPDSYLNNLGASQNFLQGGLSQALNQVTSTIGNNTSSPVTKGLSMAINGIGQNVIKGVGSSVARNVGQQIGSQVLKGGAILFLTTFTLVFAPNGSPSPCFNCSARLISIQKLLLVLD